MRTKEGRVGTDAQLANDWEAYFATRSVEARNQLVERYLPLLSYHALAVYRSHGRRVEFDDLFNAGVFGLMDAIKAYDPTRGVKFATFCVQRIRGSMGDEIRNQDHLSRSMRLRVKHAGIDHLTPISISAMKHRHPDGHEEGFEVIDSKAVAPGRDLQDADQVERVLRGLNDLERSVMRLYYCDDVEMHVIAKGFGLSPSRISQIHADVLARLQDRFANGGGGGADGSPATRMGATRDRAPEDRARRQMQGLRRDGLGQT